ncbi:hypothetical protein BXO88_09935 [Oribacterium sp. C9]|nr:hypothetical protein BXO88_09935 [Oribacterium sp. C9]
MEMKNETGSIPVSRFSTPRGFPLGVFAFDRDRTQGFVSATASVGAERMPKGMQRPRLALSQMNGLKPYGTLAFLRF